MTAGRRTLSEAHPKGQATERWDTRANCADTDPEVFFPISERSPEVKTALRICRHCTVRLECLGRAIDTDERYGIRGGKTARQRRALIRRMNNTA